MPLSPLTKLLAALALMAFPVVFATMMRTGSWAAPGSLVAALSLWAAAIWGMVRSGGAFDERAFHATRPRGKRKAFLRSSLPMICFVMAVAAMAAFRGWYYHLGWRAALGGALIVFVLLFLFTFAVATGFMLAFCQSRATRAVAWGVIGLPLLAHVVMVETKGGRMWPGALVFESWTANLHVNVVWAAAGFALAWWLAARRALWWPSLAACTLAGVTLSLIPDGESLPGTEGDGLPPAKLSAKRIKLTVPEPVAEEDATGYVRLRHDDLLELGSLRDDEMAAMWCVMPPIPGKHEELPTGPIERIQIAFAHWNRRGSGSPSGLDPHPFLASLLPSHPQLEASAWPDVDMRFRREMVPEALEAFRGGDWKLGGTVLKVEYSGSVPLHQGGRLRLAGGGSMVLEPAARHGRGFSVSCTTLTPSPRFRPDRNRPGLPISPFHSETIVRFHLLLTNRSGSKAMGTRDFGGSRATVIASEWRKVEYLFNEWHRLDWPEEELAGARVHVFASTPVAEIDQKLPPPDSAGE